MGMYNAIIDDELLNPLGIYKERLSQSALVAEMSRVTDDEAQRGARAGSTTPGMTFHTGTDEATELTDGAGARASSRCTSPRCASPTTSAATPSASSTSRASRTSCPPATSPRACSTTSSGRRCAAATARASCTPGAPLPHFNEVDEGVGGRRAGHQPRLDGDGPRPGDHAARRPLGRGVRRPSSSGSSRSPARCPPRTTAATTSRWSMRQPPMYFPLGGGTLSGVSQAGRDRLVAGVHHGRRAPRRPRAAATALELPGRGDPAPAGRHQPAVADHARRPARRHPRPVHGPAQGEPPPGRLRAATPRPPTRRCAPRPRCSPRSASASTCAARRPPRARRPPPGRSSAVRSSGVSPMAVRPTTPSSSSALSMWNTTPQPSGRPSRGERRSAASRPPWPSARSARSTRGSRSRRSAAASRTGVVKSPCRAS